MNNRNKSINLFNRKLSTINNSLFSPVQNESIVITPNTSTLTLSQYKQLLQIEEVFTSKLSNKAFVNIPSNMDEYVTLLNGIQGMNKVDYTNSTYQLLLSIGNESLIGSLQMYSIYERSMFDDLKIMQLNNSLDEILSKANEVVTMSEVSGQFKAVKTIRLAPLYNDYIYLYGLPSFGVGFDSVKLAFVSKIRNK